MAEPDEHPSADDGTPPNEHHDALITGLTTMLNSGKYSDLTMECGDRKWDVHKALMCSASPVIEKACDNPMQEGLSNVIKHIEFDAETVDHMITYVYTRHYDVEEEAEFYAAIHAAEMALDDNPEWNGEVPIPNSINAILVAHANAYAIGDYYQIPTLKTFAADRFDSISGHGCLPDGFVDVITAIWPQTLPNDKGMRDRFWEYALAHYWKLVLNEEFQQGLLEEEKAHEFIMKLIQHTKLERKEEEHREMVVCDRRRARLGREPTARERRKDKSMSLTEREQQEEDLDGQTEQQKEDNTGPTE